MDGGGKPEARLGLKRLQRGGMTSAFPSRMLRLWLNKKTKETNRVASQQVYTCVHMYMQPLLRPAKTFSWRAL